MLIYLRVFVYPRVANASLNDDFVTSLNTLSQSLLKIVCLKVQDQREDSDELFIEIKSTLRIINSLLKNDLNGVNRIDSQRVSGKEGKGKTC